MQVVRICTREHGIAGDQSLLAAFRKSPVQHYTRAAAKEFAGRGISVTSIGPGPMDTPFFYGEEPSERVEFHKSQALGNRLTKIEDIAPIVSFLAPVAVVQYGRCY